MKGEFKNPSHYVEGRQFEPKDVIRDWGLNFNLGNAVKYLARAGRKDDIVQDLRKAQHYIQFEIEAIEAGKVKEAKAPIHTGSENRAMPQMGIIELKAPVGTPPEQLIAMLIKKIYGAKE